MLKTEKRERNNVIYGFLRKTTALASALEQWLCGRKQSHLKYGGGRVRLLPKLLYDGKRPPDPSEAGPMGS